MRLGRQPPPRMVVASLVVILVLISGCSTSDDRATEDTVAVDEPDSVELPPGPAIRLRGQLDLPPEEAEGVVMILEQVTDGGEAYVTVETTGEDRVFCGIGPAVAGELLSCEHFDVFFDGVLGSSVEVRIWRR